MWYKQRRGCLGGELNLAERAGGNFEGLGGESLGETWIRPLCGLDEETHAQCLGELVRSYKESQFSNRKVCWDVSR